nr:DUF4258 domain-containing protein [Candidatus Sigynarchaeum springense]
MIIIPKHAQEQMKKRGIDEMEVVETIKNYEVIFEEENGRFGVKRYSKMPFGAKSLIVVWFVNKSHDEEVITAYWRRNKSWEQ